MSGETKLSLDAEAYEQNYQQFRSLNQIMWQIPVLAMTLTGGLWFGVSKIENNPLLAAVLLLTAVVGNLTLSVILYRFRFVMRRYLAWLKLANPKGFVDAMDLSRFDAAPLIAFTATKEMNYGTQTDGRIPQGCGAHRPDQRADAQAGC